MHSTSYTEDCVDVYIMNNPEHSVDHFSCDLLAKANLS